MKLFSGIFSAVLLLLATAFSSRSQQQPVQIKLSSPRIINFKEQAEYQKQHPAVKGAERSVEQGEDKEKQRHKPGPVKGNVFKYNINQPKTESNTGSSPAPISVFNGTQGNGSVIPPDINAVAGNNTYIFETNNQQFDIFDKSGSLNSSLIISNFFNAAVDFYGDPHVVYNATRERYMVVIDCEYDDGDGGICVAVSETSDPTGNWYIYSIDNGISYDETFYDYPMIGFNNNWMVVTMNLFEEGEFPEGIQLFVFDRADLYNGSEGNVNTFTDPDAWSLCPSTTNDTTESTEYMVEVWNGDSSSYGYIRTYTITGTPTAPVYTPGNFMGVNQTWNDTGIGATQLGSSFTIDDDDSRISSAVYNKGSLWFTHTSMVPAASPTHDAVDWWQINPATAALQQFGRIEDPSGSIFYFYPSININSQGSVLVGYTLSSSTMYASAGYSFRVPSDPLNTMEGSYTYQKGLASYYNTDGGSRNRWGDFSGTVVDPVNNTFWTLQEYTSSLDNWGITIANVAGSECTGKPAAGSIVTPGGVCSGQSAVLNLQGYSTGVLGLKFSWQKSSNNISWSAAGGDDTIIPYSTTALSAKTYFRCIVSCPGSGMADTTASVAVNINSAPVTPSCQPATLDYCCNYGITNVQVNTINNSTLAGAGYQNYTCTQQTTLIEGNSYIVNVMTNPSEPENVRIWIDYGNNGQFNATADLASVSDSITGMHACVIQIPDTVKLGTSIRMRVMSDASGYTITGPCYNPYVGSVQDYTLIFTAAALEAPVANFIANDTLINTGHAVTFSDLSSNSPTGWSWTLSGGVPSSSTSRNPAVVYNTPGYYTVSLTASNSYGSNTATKTSYIHVVNAFDMCNQSGSRDLTGTLYSSGGPNGGYGDYEECDFLINPPCAATITLQFVSFNTGDGEDYLEVYDDSTAYANLLLSVSGSILPANVTSTTGIIYLEWSSGYDYSSYPGYQINWTSTLISSPQIKASFSVSDSNPPLNTPVQFTDMSQPGPEISWLWNFGDGTYSSAQNPSHTYAAPGKYKVSLIVNNCSTQDSVSHTVAVQQAPSVTVSPSAFSVSPSCNDSVTVAVVVTNSGAGTAVVSPFKTAGKDSLQVLALLYEVDLFNEYPNTISAINTYFTSYHLNTINTTSPAALQSALTGMDVLLIPNSEYGISTVFTSFAPIIQGFINNGGSVIICGQDDNTFVFNAGLFTGDIYTTDYGGTDMTILQPNNVLMNGVTSPFYSADLTTSLNITNSNIANIVSLDGGDVVAAYQTNSGAKVVYVGYDFYYSGEIDFSQTIANAFQWVKQSAGSIGSSIHVKPQQLIVTPASADTFHFTVLSQGMATGANLVPVILYTNDPLHPQDTLNFTVNISPAPCPSFTYLQQGCSLGVLFTGTSTNSPTSYVWNFDDGNSSTGASITHTYSSAGTYNVSLIVSNSYATDTITQKVVVNASNCIDMCSVTSTTQLTGYLYDSGGPNGEYGPGENCSLLIQPSCATSITLQFISFDTDYDDYMYVYDGTNSSGTLLLEASGYGTPYPVTAISGSMYISWSSTTYSDLGYYEASWSTVQAPGSPVKAAFTPNTAYPNPGQAVSFINNSTGTPQQTLWLFGDGSESTSQNPAHTYYYQGVYTVVLIETNCTYTDTTTELITVAISPVVEINPSSVSINNSCSSDTSIVSLQIFNVGLDTADVNLGFEGNPPSWGQITSPASLTILPGAYSLLTLNVNSFGLATGTYTANITVFSNDLTHPMITVPVSFDVSGKPCASFSYSSDTCSGIIQFYDNSSSNVTGWNWNFGDGITSSLSSPAHQYHNNNSYMVTLTATNSNGSNSVSSPVDINYLIAGNILPVGNLETASPISFFVNVPGAVSWNWSFGDNDSSTLSSPVHTYSKATIYVVSVLVTNKEGCSGILTDTLDIFNTSVAGINGNFANAMLYPNPASDVTTLYYETSEGGVIDIALYDVEGRLINTISAGQFISQGVHRDEIQLPLASGAYYIRMRSQGNTVSLPLIKVE